MAIFLLKQNIGHLHLKAFILTNSFKNLLKRYLKEETQKLKQREKDI